MPCHNCGSDKTEVDNASGISVCVNCGVVLEENRIVSEVAFAETSGGKAVVQGSYAGESGRISGGGLFGRSRGREGQEQAIENGRLKISSLAHAVHLPERYRDSAQRYYNLAVVNRFTRGRRSDFVAAVCLYAVCRTEKSSHMLIDFSDILQVNVFTLGATFLKLCRVLNLTLPHVDPSLYISRFAVALDFGDYTQRVAQDAVRIAQRMDRDWITSGRRPAGICGACLLIAARMNGFRRTTREMIYVVKVADITIQKRLKEFNQTESSQLSVRDFRTIWLENRADPPSYQKNRKGESSRTVEAKKDDQKDEVEEEHDESEDESEDENTTVKHKYTDADDESDKEEVVPASRKRKRDTSKPSSLSKEIDVEGPSDEEAEADKRPSKKSKGKSVDSSQQDKDKKVGLPASRKRKMDIATSSLGKEINVEESSDEEEEAEEKRTAKKNKGKAVDRSSQQDKKYYVEGSADEALSDDEIVGPFKGPRVDVSEGLPTEEDLILKEIEDSLNEGIKEAGEDCTLATTASNEDLILKEIENSEEVNNDTEDPSIITIKDPAFEHLTTEEKRALTLMAKAKVANEVAELLNPELQEDTRIIADDMEQWLGDESINKAAAELEKTKHAADKNGEEEEDEEDEEDEDEDGNLSDVDDEEIEAMILTDREVALKTKIWYNANKDYLEEMAVRRVLESNKNYSHRKGKGGKKKKLPPPSTPAEAAKQLLMNKKLSKKINQEVFDDMFESAESIAKIKQRDAILKLSANAASPITVAPVYEVVEEPGDIPDPNAPKKTSGSDDEEEKPAEVVEEDDDEEMDSDDMADDERLLRDARAKYTFGEDDDEPEYYDEEDY
ncbi:hypothetical protein HPULCUR_006346 [Helicostylum pulchrum]|uniref:B-related factor 1 n=1 Tax=Helicostylum pulchrum TaxID=562976 RepID=A0ABP9Y1N2_9FUNG